MLQMILYENFTNSSEDVCWTRCVAQVAHALIVVVVGGAGGACVAEVGNTVPNIPLLTHA